MAARVPDSGTLPVNVGEWLEALRTVTPAQNDEGVSLIELAEMWGISTSHTLLRLKALNRRGLVKVGTRESVSLIGRRSHTPVYRVTLPPKARKGGNR